MKGVGFLFDMDGVVVDNMSFHEQAWRKFFEVRGITMSREDFYRKTSGMPTKDVMAFFLKRELTAEEIKANNKEKESLYRELYRPHMRPAKGLVEFLDKSRAAGIKVGLGTGSMPDNVDFILDGLKLRGQFDAVVGAGDVRNGKPHPETFLKLAEKLGVVPAKCVVIEDAMLGIKAARAGGMAVVAVTTTHLASDFMDADLIAADFTSLSPERLTGLVK